MTTVTTYMVRKPTDLDEVIEMTREIRPARKRNGGYRRDNRLRRANLQSGGGPPDG